MKITEARTRMQKALDHFISEMSKVQGSRANPHLIEEISVSVYDSIMPIQQLGTVTVVDPTLITVSCWDKTNVEAIKKGIDSAELGLSTAIDGSVIRVVLPPLTEERRVELVKIIKNLSEETKVSLRRTRRDFLDSLEEAGVTEDEVSRGEKEVQTLIENFNKDIDNALETKEKELMTI